ncbi:hypothetical protein CW751_08530 [Brumimicrobium salinarum]|uniref:ATPase BadF/BadG/BcrA/BcrD type domain-containing protein n=1 Tax=Brumimicrobium salinarum TaxID=2058658 RepID=A0A2I0R2J3_9FLAO|nr:hypothetical protein [Brumimicrobium salinarum]PKR80804.1 hypothetical protein CW751_08530 [Brumimicrobium salinarum]
MVVIESGGTKSTWLFKSSSGDLQKIISVGLHPREITQAKIQTIQKIVLENHLQEQSVYFYGAGCENKTNKQIIIDFFEKQQMVVRCVETDVLAACISHLGRDRGVVGVLGTGAVAAMYNGKKIVKQTSGLGYILGDEGSGFDIGKRLLQHYFHRKLPEVINLNIENYFNNESILACIYGKEGRMQIAGLTKVVAQFSDHSLMKDILRDAFNDFCKEALTSLGKDYPIHFVGSVAYYFKSDLFKCLKTNGYQPGNVHIEAVHKLYDFLSE